MFTSVCLHVLQESQRYSDVRSSAARDTTRRTFPHQSNQISPSWNALQQNSRTLPRRGTFCSPLLRLHPKSCWGSYSNTSSSWPLYTHKPPLPASQISQGDRTNKHEAAWNRVPGRLVWCHQITLANTQVRRLPTRSVSWESFTAAHKKGRLQTNGQRSWTITHIVVAWRAWELNQTGTSD